MPALSERSAPSLLKRIPAMSRTDALKSLGRNCIDLDQLLILPRTKSEMITHKSSSFSDPAS